MPISQTALGNDESGQPTVVSWSYASIVGMLLYVGAHTRADICFAVSQVARFTHNPKGTHVKAIKILLCYLKRTCDNGITFRLP